MVVWKLLSFLGKPMFTVLCSFQGGSIVDKNHVFGQNMQQSIPSGVVSKVRANPDVRPWWHSLDLHTWWMLRNCWGGVGWGGVGMMTFFELEHMVDATHTWWMLRNCWGGVGWGRDDDILWTCTHGGCYATAGVGWGGVGMMTFFGLAHMVDATQLLGWGGVGRDDDILWTWTHGGCYAHMVDATQLLGWGGVGWGWWHSLNLHKKHGWLTGDVENASKLEEAEERTAWYEPCQEKKGPSAARAKVRVAAQKFILQVSWNYPFRADQTMATSWSFWGIHLMIIHCLGWSSLQIHSPSQNGFVEPKIPCISEVMKDTPNHHLRIWRLIPGWGI